MKDIIRWPGIIIALVLVCLVYFLIEPLLKLVIEETGSRTLSTKVTLEAVEIAWSDQSLTLKGLEVADKDSTMKNTVEIDHIALQIDALDALTGHLLSEQAHILGIQFNTPRSESGKLDKPSESSVKPKDTDDDSSLPSFDLTSLGLPDINTLVSKENSITYQRYQALKKYLDEAKTTYKVRLKGLKDPQKIDDYKARFKEIKKAKGFVEILSAASKAKDLKNDIDKDISEAKQLNRDFKQTRKEVERRIAELKASPKQEADMLLQEFGIENGSKKISQYLFGPEIKAHIKKLTSWFKTISDSEKHTDSSVKEQPLERGKGVFVQFARANPLPLVWFKNTQLSGDFTGLDIPFTFKGEAQHLTDQQTLTKKATTLDLNLKNDVVQNADVNIVVDIRTEQKLSLTFDIKEYRLEQQPLSANFTLNNALLDTKGDLRAIDEQLSGEINVELNAVSLTATGDAFKQYPAIEKALADEDRIIAQIKLKGTIDSPQTDVSSNLDAIFNKVLKKVVEEQLAKYKNQVTEKIEAMLQKELNNSDASQSELLEMGGDIAGTEDIFKNLLGKL
ncbi:MAG: hypothetical protein ACI84K_000633 [Pseudohongiellaceae bacterium]|jgi:uncharacterized protein (TIGR03545 family)